MNDAGASRSSTELLLVEDDDGDALIVEELLIDSGEEFTVRRATSLRQAIESGADADCALVDLGLPDAQGLGALHALRGALPDLPIVVLTGLADRSSGIESLTHGAQDYLVKGEVNGLALARAIRYAVERRRADGAARRLLLSEQRQRENERLAQGLLPLLKLDGPIDVATRYQPGADATLGGDFYDAWLTDDGCLRAVIGDVCGHGPAEAAVGVALRITWRAMTLAGEDPGRTLAAMHDILLAERDEREPFATVCDLSIDLHERTLTVRLHGHPPPLLLAGADVTWVDEAKPAMPLGLLDEHLPAVPGTVDLDADWALLLLTDGIYEGRVADGRLGEDAFLEIVQRLAEDRRGAEVLDALVAEVQGLHGGDLDDDIALLWLAGRR